LVRDDDDKIQKIYAHKAILSTSSEYFEKRKSPTLKSLFTIYFRHAAGMAKATDES